MTPVWGTVGGGPCHSACPAHARPWAWGPAPPTREARDLTKCHLGPFQPRGESQVGHLSEALQVSIRIAGWTPSGPQWRHTGTPSRPRTGHLPTALPGPQSLGTLPTPEFPQRVRRGDGRRGWKPDPRATGLGLGPTGSVTGRESPALRPLDAPRVVLPWHQCQAQGTSSATRTQDQSPDGPAWLPAGEPSVCPPSAQLLVLD